MIRRTFVRYACLSLALGFVSSIAVAWGLWLRWAPAANAALFVSVPPASGSGPPLQGLIVFLPARSGSGEMFKLQFSPESATSIHGRDLQAGLVDYAIDVGSGPFKPTLPDWARAHVFRLTDEPSSYITQGWPMRCVRGQQTDSTKTVGTIQIMTAKRWPARALAYIPIWPGLAGNTLLYGSAWFALILAFRFAAIRRRWRAAKGLCQACGYDVKGDPACPECGLGMERQ